MIVKGDNKLIDNIKAVLLIQIGDIGDVVLSLPVLRALKENLPDASIIFAVRSKAAELAEECQWADSVLSINTDKRNMISNIKYQAAFLKKLRSYNIDLAVDLRMDMRGAALATLSGARQKIGFFAEGGSFWRNRVFTNMFHQRPVPGGRHMTDYLLNLIKAFKVTGIHPNPEIKPSKKKTKEAKKLLQSIGIAGPKPIIAIQPFSLWPYKEWETHKYIELIQWLTTSLKMSVIITGSPDEHDRIKQITNSIDTPGVYNLAGKTDIGILPALFQQCILFIGIDSAGLHIAAAVGTPTVGIYGPAATMVWAPRGERHHMVTKDMPCVPCNLKGCKGSEKSQCLEELSVGEVSSVVAKKLGINYK